MTVLDTRQRPPVLLLDLSTARRDRGTVITLVRLGTLALAGSLPILAISMHVFGLISLATTAREVVLPATLIVVALMLQGSPEARLGLNGLVAGLVAVTAYDCLRMPFVFAHIWPDFLPRVGGWALGQNTPSIPMGYLWRYLGDGGGLGMVFFIGCAVLGIRRRPVAWALAYAVFVWGGLIATVALAPHGQELMFRLTPTSFGLSLAGHIVYGSTLGLCYRRQLSSSRSAGPVLAGRGYSKPELTISLSADAGQAPGTRPVPHGRPDDRHDDQDDGGDLTGAVAAAVGSNR